MASATKKRKLSHGKEEEDRDGVSPVLKVQPVQPVQAVTRCANILKGHANPVILLDWAHDSAQLASGSGDRTVHVWNVHDISSPQFTLTAETNVCFLAYAPDGKRIAVGCVSGKMLIFCCTTGRQSGRPLQGHGTSIKAIYWKPQESNGDSDSRLVATAATLDSVIKIWDIENRKYSVSLSNNHQVTAMRWGQHIYAAYIGGYIKVWRENGTSVRKLRHEGPQMHVTTMSLNSESALRTGGSPKEKELLATGSTALTCYLWDPTKTEPIASMGGHLGPVSQVMFSADGMLIATLAYDSTIRVFDGNNGQHILELRGAGGMKQGCWSPDSRLLCVTSGATVQVWNVDKKEKVELAGHAEKVTITRWSPDGKKLATGGDDKYVKIWVE